jgi:hypothetical protein
VELSVFWGVCVRTHAHTPKYGGSTTAIPKDPLNWRYNNRNDRDQMANLLNQTLQRLEKHLQNLIEGNSARLFPAYDFQKALSNQLIEAMQIEIRTTPDGNMIAPNLFTVFLPAEQAEIFQDQPELLDGLANCLVLACQDAQVRFVSEPIIKIVPNPEQDHPGIQIVGQFSLSQKEETSTLEPLGVSPGDEPTQRAFLIVDGVEIFQLDGKILRIGQNKENDLVINHPQVSQEHAQLRLVNGQYTIFDLNSTGGTFVNGVKVSQSFLSPGDVISLGGLPVVFGIENRSGLDETQEISPGS